jgi:hydrogenase maturation protease
LHQKKITVYGYGNPGRQDDGLGPALISMLDEHNINGVVTDSNYQLNIEDAELVSNSDCVVFVDATMSGDEAFTFTEIEASNDITFTTHAMSPESVLALCQELYDKSVKAYVLAVRGYGWNFQEGLTPEAEINLGKAFNFLLHKIDEFLHDERSRMSFIN